MSRRLVPITIVALLVAAWQLAGASGGVTGFVLPAPSRILAALWDERDLAVHNTLVTLGEAVVGFGASLALAVAAALAMDLAPALRRALYPLLVGSQAVPILVVAPILVLWFGFGLLPKAIVIVLLTFFPIVVGLLDGFAAVPADADDLFRTYGATSGQTLRLLRVPTALPSFFTGIRIAVTYALLGAVYAEYVGAFDGLGIWILTSQKSFRIDLVFGAVLIVLVISVGLFWLVGRLERVLVPWSPRRRGA
ncbi:MAG TPA: ABC transporter permease [Candidatus Limnocylindrales bacterium]|nr:ABC transporter permease [Candidatus Limnocylindrales bacterium]